MRNILLILVIAALPISMAVADPLVPQKPAKNATFPTTPDKQLSTKRRGDINACSAYGPGFVKVDGADTCVKLGGAVGIGVSGGR